MSEPRVRVLVGEGQPARRGLFRFVLENSGFDVVAEAASTMELAQQVAIHRPDVVVLDDGIDVTAVAMLRDVQPSAKVILVWPRGVAAVGADARLEPGEVMNALGPTVARVTGAGAVITMPPEPPTPRAPVPDVIVVPEPDTRGATAVPVEAEEAEPAPAVGSPGSAIEPPGAEAAPAAIVTGSPVADTIFPPGGRTQAPRWTYTAATVAQTRGRRSRWPIVVAAVVIGATLLSTLGFVALADPRTVPVASLIGTVGDARFPSVDEGTFTEPGTYEGFVTLRAQGTLRVRASGVIELRLDGASRIVARGQVRVSGDGVVRNVSDRSAVRVRGSGTIRIVIDGSLRVRLDGSLSGTVDGTVRIAGDGAFEVLREPR
jgi:CheY-like chemotaxis protein